jgi:hypothetical protein
MSDVPHCQRNKRQTRIHKPRIDDFGMPRQCADANEFAARFDAAKLLNAIYVDQEFRRGEPHIQRRHQTLAAG